MTAGKLAAQVACKAIEEEEVTRENLWPYNVAFMGAYGAKAACLDIFRVFIQKSTDPDLNYAMEHRLTMEEDILRASMSEDLRLNIIAEKLLRR